MRHPYLLQYSYPVSEQGAGVVGQAAAFVVQNEVDNVEQQSGSVVPLHGVPAEKVIGVAAV